MRLRQLEYFAAVAEHLSFTKAARSLGVSQPVVSRQIRILEAELGARLLRRTSRDVTLTPVGRAFLSDAERVVRTIDAAKARIAAGRDPAALHVGTYSTAGLRLIREVVLAYEAAGPGHSVDLSVLRWDEVSAALQDRTVDAAFVTTAAGERFPDHDGLLLTELIIDERVAVVRGDHPLAGRREISIEELTPYGFVGTGNQSAGHNRWWNVDPRPDGSRPRITRSVATVGELLETVVLTGDVAITTRTIADSETRTDVVFLPLVDVDPAALYIAHPKGRAAPHIHEFVDVARGAARSYQSRMEGPPA